MKRKRTEFSLENKLPKWIPLCHKCVHLRAWTRYNTIDFHYHLNDENGSFTRSIRITPPFVVENESLRYSCWPCMQKMVSNYVCNT